ncbi:hypothetical protein NW759_007330 [Fusarium solani]|nr:hypothetical protein NW759_007330 [Fusarium solani]
MRLVDTTSSAFKPASRFAALSHMWGDISTSPPLQTFQSNLEQLRQNIEPTDLPKNFADAARVCIRLGIPYLWIDSLCIIQNSADDWKREAVKMHLVYRHAVVTIVATSATSTHDGFLDRDFKKTLAAKIHYSLEYDQESSPSGHGRNRYIVFYRRQRYEDSFPTYAINNSKWNTRAWTMQERSLSTRLIHFCRNKIFFECRSCIKSEENEPAAHYALMTRILWPRDPSTSWGTLYEYWQWCLMQHCPRNLTKGKDKLIAIQSVAEEMMSTTKWEYIRFAGMWRHKIKEELFWIFPYGEARRPDASRAPSWSWSALDGHVSFNPRILPKGKRSVPEPLALIFEEIKMEVIDVYPSREDTPSDEIHGYLEVKAWVRPISTVVRAKSVNDDEEFFMFKLVAGTDGVSHGSGEQEHVFAHGRLDMDAPRGNARLLYLHIGVDKRPTGLILELGPEDTTRTGKSPEVWRRVGVATLFDDERGLILSQNLFGTGTGRSRIIMV